MSFYYNITGNSSEIISTLNRSPLWFNCGISCIKIASTKLCLSATINNIPAMRLMIEWALHFEDYVQNVQCYERIYYNIVCVYQIIIINHRMWMWMWWFSQMIPRATAALGLSLNLPNRERDGNEEMRIAINVKCVNISVICVFLLLTELNCGYINVMLNWTVCDSGILKCSIALLQTQ